jgi:foldase protein PrsA
MLALLFLLTACAPSGMSYVPPPAMGAPRAVVENASCPPAPVVTGPRLGRGGQGAVVARVGGREISAEDLTRELFKGTQPLAPGTTLRQAAFATLNRLVIREIIEQESRRIGLKPPDEWLAAERARVLEDLKVQALTSYGAGTTPERFLELEMKQSLADWQTHRDSEAWERWMLSRIIRYHGIQSERVEIQLIAVDDEKTAREVAGKLDQGADFGQLAVTYSRHPSGKGGGKLPPLARESLNPAVADRAFALAPGARSNILSVDDGFGKRQFEVVKLLRRIPSRRVPWGEVATEIEDGLSKEAVGPEEFIAWNLRAERLYSVWVDPDL